MRRSDIFTFIVLFIMVAAILGSIIAGEWLPGLQVAMWTVALSVLSGIALSYSNFPSFAAHITASIYGLFVVAVLGGTRPEVAIAGPWRERITLMIEKVASWVREAMNNGSSKETLIFLLLVVGLIWMLGYSAAWYSFRHRRIWHVILPAGVTLLANVYQYNGNNSMAPYLILYLVCALLLLVQSHFSDRETEWLRERVRFTPSLRASFLLAGGLIGLVALLFSWRLTAVASTPDTLRMLQRLNTPYNEVLARWNRMFASLNNYNLRNVDRFGKSLPLEGPRNLSPEPVMLVSVAEGRHFWRAQNLDTYDGSAWHNSSTEQRSLEPYDMSIPLPKYDYRGNVTADFTLFRGTDSLLASSQPVLASVATNATLAKMDDGGIELQQLALSVPLLAGNRYATAGSTSTADPVQLQIASTQYPAWITDRYLQLPNNISDRVKALGQNIVSKAGALNSFDQAVAIESYLRTNIEYDEKLDAPPVGVEASEYILYMTKRAYCNYYATAMIVMLRSMGVPARMAVGYANGMLDNTGQSTTPEEGRVNYLVRGTDAHAWVEVFFPEYGWVEFEPTAGQPPIDRRLSENDLAKKTAQERGVSLPPPTPTPSPIPAAGSTQQPGQPAATTTPTPNPQSGSNAAQPPSANNLLKQALDRLLNSFLPYLLLLPIAYFGARFGLRWAERAGLTGLPIIAQIYGMLLRWMSWMGIGKDHTLTPFERAEEFAANVPEAGASARRITELYVARRFSREGLQASPNTEANEIQAIWANIRRALPKVWLRLRILRRSIRH